ncbi:MAG TPA: hypothetical protein VGF30_14685 [Bacteroidia bacterium]
MSKLIGAFVFEDLGDGCLTGKWLNNNEPTPYPEAAKLKRIKEEEKKEKEPFEGLYTTTWIELRDQPEYSDLFIEKRGEIYHLEWRNGNNIIFQGRGMLYRNILIGPYWQ